MLEIQNLSVHYGMIQAVHDVSFHVNQGEIVSLIGANGAGKTTILRTISGLIRPSNGSVTFEGKRIEKEAPQKIVANGLSQVPEGRHVFSGLTVQENLEMGAFLRKDSGVKEDYEQVYRKFPVLAPIFIKEIFSIIQEIKQQGTTVLLIEQNAKMALSIADRGYVLETGKIVLEGTGEELLASDEVRKAYLGG